MKRGIRWMIIFALKPQASKMFSWYDAYMIL
jgi:hypothetical protein